MSVGFLFQYLDEGVERAVGRRGDASDHTESHGTRTTGEPCALPPATPLIGSLDDGDAGIEPLRLWEVMRRFFRLAAQIIENDYPVVAGKLRQATPYWMRHTHATHALAKGVELSVVRDNPRHASISTTSIYLHADDVKRARQFGEAFTA